MSGPDNREAIARASGFEQELDMAERRRQTRVGKKASPAQDLLEPPAPKPVRKKAAASAYSCALWSDGIVEVRCGSDVIAEIPKAAAQCLADFMNGLKPKQGEAA